MPRVVIDPRNVHGGAVAITDPQALHHLLDVLRVTDGERVECVDGAGRWYAARVARRSTRELQLEIVDQGEEPRVALAVRLVPALIKPERFEWLVQKTTELGVERISPVMTARSVIRPSGERRAGRLARWQRIANAAAQQCGRATVPQIDPPAVFRKVLASLASVGSDPKHKISEVSRLGSDPTQLAPQPSAPSLVLLPTLAGTTVPLREALATGDGLTSVVVCIGPEGDFTPEEVVLAQHYGAVPVSLGRRTLRSETAAVAVLAVLQHTAGEL